MQMEKDTQSKRASSDSRLLQGEPHGGTKPTGNEPRTYFSCLHEGEQILQRCGIQEADTDAWLLMEYAAKISRTYYSIHRDEEIPSADAERFLTLIRRRGEHVPVQYLTGEAWFWGRPFRVSPAVLIPRQDTETLVYEAEKRMKPGSRILDMCTGSGCILLSLLADSAEGRFGKEPCAGVGADLSEQALETARENQRLLHIEDSMVSWVQGDLFENIDGAFDMIVSNPPYIASGVIPDLDPEVCGHEPVTALDGKADGLYFERKIAEEAPGYLRRGGWLLLEIGYDQGQSMREILMSLGYEEVAVIRDLAGNDRVAAARRKAS